MARADYQWPMIYFYLLVSCVAFVELFMLFRLRRDVSTILSLSREAVQVMMSPELGDDAKEAFMRRASARMFKSTLLFVLKFLLIVAVLYAIFAFTVYLAPEIEGSILQSVVSPVVIVLLTIATAGYVYGRNGLRKQL